MLQQIRIEDRFFDMCVCVQFKFDLLVRLAMVAVLVCLHLLEVTVHDTMIGGKQVDSVRGVGREKAGNCLRYL